MAGKLYENAVHLQGMTATRCTARLRLDVFEITIRLLENKRSTLYLRSLLDTRDEVAIIRSNR